MSETSAAQGDWLRERAKASWGDEEVQRGEFRADGWSSEFHECSIATHLICGELWSRWHEGLRGKKKWIRLDAISIEGETIVEAACKVMGAPEIPFSDRDIGQVAAAIRELRDAGLVVQRSVGSWELYFGEPLTTEELVEVELERAETRLRYADDIGASPGTLLSNLRED